MDKKLVNREIRRVSNFSSLPILIFILLQQIAAIAENYIAKLILNSGAEFNYELYILIAYCVQYIVVTGLAIFIFYKTRGKSTGLRLSQVFGKPQKSLGWILKWYVISYAFIYLANFFTIIVRFIISAVFNVEGATPEFYFGDSLFATFAMLFSLSVLAPLFEEMLFRGTVYRNTEIMGQAFAVVVSGIAFGLWHMNYAQLLYTCVMGIFMSFMAAKTRSIVPTLIFHFLNNTVSGLLSLVVSSGGNRINMDMESIQGLMQGDMTFLQDNLPMLIIMELLGFAVMGIVVAGIVLFIVTLVRHRREKKFMDGIFPVKGVKKTAIFFSAPITVITFVLLIIGNIARAIG